MDITTLVAAEGAGGTIADAIADVSTLFTSASNMITDSRIAMAFVWKVMIFKVCFINSTRISPTTA